MHGNNCFELVVARLRAHKTNSSINKSRILQYIMADIVTTRNWIISIGNTTAGVATAIIEQGLTITELHDLDPDDVKTLCSSARRPGGVHENGDPNLGTNVPTMLQLKLIVAVRAAQFYDTVGRTIAPAIMSWAYVKQFKSLKELTSNWKELPALPTLGRNVPIMKLLELIREHLRGILGIRQIPLAYVTRAMVTPDPIGVIRADRPFSENHGSFHEELIARASHAHPNYVDDNAAVLDILVGCLGETEYLTSLKPFQRARDGRGALLALETQNLGDSKWDMLIKRAEQTVLNFNWNGKNNKYTLDRHIVSHRAAHNDMVRASESTPYQPPNDHTRVQRLLNSIVSTDIKVVSAVTTILADRAKRDDFEEAADFLLLAAPVPLLEFNLNHTVSGVTDLTNDDSSSGFEINEVGTTGVELRYYTREAFRNLPQEQRDELAAWNEKRKSSQKRKADQGVESGPKQGRNSKRSKKRRDKVASLESQIEELKATISAATTSPAPTLPPTPMASNATNSALTRVPRHPTQNGPP